MTDLRLESVLLEETSEARVELHELADNLTAEGFTVNVAGRDESVHAKLQESVGGDFVCVLSVVLDNADGVVAIGVILREVRKWAKRRKSFGAPDDDIPTVIIWGPDGEILQEVPLDDESD